MTAVITGGSRGIGLGIAKELLKNGFTVVLSARKISDDVELLKREYGEKVCFVPCDISDMSGVDDFVSEVKEKFGKIDLLVNNAGVAPKERKDILELNPDEFDYVIDINI